MSLLRRKFARLAGLLVLIAGLAGASMPGFAAAPAPAQAKSMHAGMDCDGERHDPAPKPHLPAGDCCQVSICAMNLALPAAPSGLAFPSRAEKPGYELRGLHPPLGIVTAPIPHPPKAQA